MLPLLLTLGASASAAVSRTGPDDPKLRSFDRLMESFVTDHHVPGASLAVARNGRLVYARGFGLADREAREPVEPTSLFRIASVSKMFTSAAVMQLVQQRRLRLDEPWFPLVGLHPRNDQTMDPRLARVTILELLQHRGGWDRDKSFDPMFRSVQIAQTLGTPPPAGPEQVIQYMLGQPLDFDPGARMAYSNFGYCILGRVIRRAGREPYEQYVQAHMLAPLGIRRMRLGRSLPQFRAPGEVKYYGQGKGDCVFPPNIGKPVPWCYGGWDLEAMDAHGGWIASAPELVRFAASFDRSERSEVLSAESIRQTFARPPGEAGFTADGKPRPVWYGMGWNVRSLGRGQQNTWHDGLFDGTSALVVRRSDGLDWAVLFNASADDKGKTLSDAIDPLLHKAADEVQTWPDESRDLFVKFLD